MYYISSDVMRETPRNHYTVSTLHKTNVGLILGQRRRLWANVKTTLIQCIDGACWVYVKRKKSNHAYNYFIAIFLFSEQKLYLEKKMYRCVEQDRSTKIICA